jgi:hypothetical protein
LISTRCTQHKEQEKAQALAIALGQTEPVTEDMSLADIYNREKTDFISEPKAQGSIGLSR